MASAFSVDSLLFSILCNDAVGKFVVEAIEKYAR